MVGSAPGGSWEGMVEDDGGGTAGGAPNTRLL